MFNAAIHKMEESFAEVLYNPPRVRKGMAQKIKQNPMSPKACVVYRLKSFS